MHGVVYPPYLSLELLDAKSTAGLSYGRPLLDAGEMTGGDSPLSSYGREPLSSYGRDQLPSWARVG